MNYAAAVLCVLIVLILAYHFGYLDNYFSKERLVPSSFRNSLVEVDRARQQDNTGMTVTDYVLEANMLQDLPLSDTVAIRG